MQKGGQDLSQGMDDAMGHVLCTGAKLKHRKNLRQRINGQPEPLHLRMAAQPGAEFVQLEVRDPKMAEGTLVQGLCMFPSASEPGRNGGLTKAEDPLGSRRVEPFSQRREHHCNVMRGGFQTIQRRIASSTERGTASLAAEGLDLLSLTMLAIPNEGMDVSISHAEVLTLLIETGIALRVYAFGSS